MPDYPAGAQRLSYITQIGTGNYNEKTAKQYTDFSMMTANGDIARDAVSFFQNLLIGNLWGQYETLLVAPVSMREGITACNSGGNAKGPPAESSSR